MYNIEDPVLQQLTSDAININYQLQRKANHLLFQFSQGNEKPGGYRMQKVTHTNAVFYLKDRASGARVFLHKAGKIFYELIAVGDGKQKKKNEIAVFNRLRKMYPKKS